eukprot:GFUD01037403.1.p1 GENE.GFUD01037403.1~~GFUD01037403.1.p1  ORF type:complete len:510 (-),score=148.27 GFUD01037403.1:79-1608(-)
MVLISYHVQTNNLSSYPTSLLQSLQHQSGHHTDISLTSGDQTVPVSAVLLRNCSPFLNALLQSPCSCSQQTTVTLPATTISSTLPSLVSLLYSGYVSNMSRDQVEQLRHLTKELGLRTSICDSDLIQVVSGENSGNVTDKDRSDDTSNSDSCNNTMTGGTSGERISRVVRFTDGWDREGVTGHSRDRFSDFVPMVPPVRHRTSPVNINEELSDRVLCGGIEESVSYVAFSDYNLGGVKLVYGRTNNVDEEIFEVLTEEEDIFDIDHEDVGGELDRRGDQHVVDCFSDIQLVKCSQNSYDIICEICDQTFEEESKFKTHLASTHYKARLQEDFHQFGKVCPFCEKRNSDTTANVVHLGEEHSKVYEYYGEKFGDIKHNRNGRNSKVAVIGSGLDMLSLKFGGNFQSVKPKEVKTTTFIKTKVPLKGILKLSEAKSEEKQLKSILRSSSAKSPPSQSILKAPRSKSKPVDDKHEICETVDSVTSVDSVGVTKKVVMTVQDDDGETIMDLLF